MTIDGTQYELCPMILHNRDVVQTALYKDQFIWFSLTADNKIAEIGITNSFEGELSNYNASAGTVMIKSSEGNWTYKINYTYMPEEALAFMSTMEEGAKAFVNAQGNIAIHGQNVSVEGSSNIKVKSGNVLTLNGSNRVNIS